MGGKRRGEIENMEEKVFDKIMAKISSKIGKCI